MTNQETTIEIPKVTLKKGQYVNKIGRRKQASAQVRLFEAKEMKVTVNGKDYTDYFKTVQQRKTVLDPFTKGKIADAYEITVVVKGGGLQAQATAVQHGITRALAELMPGERVGLKKLGFLKRDPRKKERKKPGLVKARKSKQWSKR